MSIYTALYVHSLVLLFQLSLLQFYSHCPVHVHTYVRTSTFFDPVISASAYKGVNNYYNSILTIQALKQQKQ